MTNDALSGELFGSGIPKKVRNSSSLRHGGMILTKKRDAVTKHRVFTKPPIEKSFIEVYRKLMTSSLRHTGVPR